MISKETIVYVRQTTKPINYDPVIYQEADRGAYKAIENIESEYVKIWDPKSMKR